MTRREAISGLLRWVSVAVASLAVALAIGYVALTSPPGMRWLANTVSREVASSLGWKLEIGSLDSDLGSYLVLRRARLALPGMGTEISVNRLHMRMSLWKLARGRLHGVRSLSIDSLEIAATVAEDTTKAQEPFAWSIAPLLPYIPDYVDVRGVTLRVRSPADTMAFSLATASLRTSVSESDSSALVALNLAGSVEAGALGTIPFAGNTHLLFRGPSLRVGGLVVQGPGIAARGHATTPDLANGPYHSQGSLRIELGELPRRVSGLELAGSVSLEGTIGWDESPIIELSLDAPMLVTPWASASDARFYLVSRDSVLSLRGSCAFAGGTVGLSAQAPVPPAPGDVKLDLALVGVDLDSVARTPAVAEALTGTHVSGRLNGRWRYSGQVRSGRGWRLRSLSSHASVDAEGLSVADVPVGTLTASWSQERTKTTAHLDALGLALAVEGTARSLDDVSLTSTISASHLDTLLRAVGVEGVDAEFSLHATVQGALASPHVAVRSEARDVVVPGMKLPDLTLVARMPSPDTLIALLKSADSRVLLDVMLLDRFAVLGRLNASLGPWPIAELPGDIAREYHLTGAISAALTGTGAVADPHLRAAIRTSPITWEGQEVGSITGDVEWGARRLTFEVGNAAKTLSGRGAVATDSGAQSNVVISWEQFELGSILAALTKQDISQTAGISDGTIRLHWSQGLPGSFSVSARLERVEMRLGNVTYQLANPPARLSLEQGVLSLLPATLVGENQRLFLEGNMTQAGDLDFTVAVDSVDLHNLVAFLTAGDLNVRGLLQARIHLGGVVGDPVAAGHVVVQRLRWRSLSIDSLGALLSLGADTLRVSDLFVGFPFGTGRGRFLATTAALGLPQASSTVEPMFRAELQLDRAGAIIQNWEGLRGGTVAFTGGFELQGGAIGDIGSYGGTLRIDSVVVSAPFNRTLTLMRPTVIRVDDRRRPLADTLGFQLRYRGRDAGRVTVAHSVDTTEPGVFIEASRLSLEDLSHLIFPLLGALDIVGVPSDLAGALSMSAWWNMDLDRPQADLGLHIRDLTAAELTADSLLLGMTLRDGVISVEYGQVYAGADTLSVYGQVNPSSDEVRLHAYTERLELVELIEDLLPPLRRYEPPPPWPTSMPLPSYGQQIQCLPPDAQGEHVKQPLTVFDRLVKERRSSIKHPYAATLPLELDVQVTGSLSDPSVMGQARLLGAYLELEYVVEPFWMPDTVLIRFAGKDISARSSQILVGTDQRASATEGRVSLDRATFSLADGSFDLQAHVSRTTFSVISTEPVVVPPKLRLFSVVLQPMLTSYYTDPVGVFTVEAQVGWTGTLTRSRIIGDVQLFSSTFQYPIAEPTTLLAPPAPTSYGIVLDNAELLLNVSTEDSLTISNNLSERASVWTQMIVSGHLNDPRFQGRVEISPGSTFRYLGREFVVEQASVDFPDPTRFEPVLDIQAKATITPPGQASSGGERNERYEVMFSASGVYPNLVKTEMTAVKQPDGEIYVNQFQIMQILIYGEIPQSYLAFDAQSKLNSYLKNRGYATISAALGTVIPVDRVTVQEQQSGVAAGQASAQTDVEVEVAQSFRLLGQNITLTAATPVGQISSLNTLQRVEMQWLILSRPRAWRPLESLSVTLGQNRAKETQTAGDLSLQNELTADVQLRIRFR